MTNFSKRNRLAKNNVKTVALTTLLSGLMLSMSSAAFAAGTPANTTVTNSYVLDYTAGGVSQETVTNVENALTFSVDRVVGLTVTGLGDQTVAAGTENTDLHFSIMNMGNDLQAYKLRVVNDSSDDFDVSNIQIFTAIDDGDGVFEPNGDDGALSILDGNVITSDVAADALIWVAIRSTIPSGRGVENGTAAQITLVAETVEPSTSASPGAPVYMRGAEQDGTSTLLADTSGSQHEMAKQGDHSATSYYNVDAANITGTTEFTVHNQDGTDCGNLSGPQMDGFAIPGACVQYRFTFHNTADNITAEDISFMNTLDTTLKFAMVDVTGFSGGTTDAPAYEDDCGATDCNIMITNASLNAGEVGVITIRALLK